MSLADLIRGKRKSVAGVATLTVATSATVGTYQAASVATVAPVTVANPQSELDNVRQTLERFAAELGFKWPELMDSGLIVETDLDPFAQDWNKSTPEQWRAYISSIGQRARHGCPGLAHRIDCDCGGQCRAFGARL